jgi:pteridine reductase
LLHYHHSDKEATETAAKIRDLGKPVRTFKADLTDYEQIKALYKTLDGFVDELSSNEKAAHEVLVNSAANMAAIRADALLPSSWDATLDLNLRAPFFCAQESARRMVKGGLIVNMTDTGAQKAWSRFPAYTISKAGLEAMTKILARAYAPAIRVNSIAPGLVLPSDSVTPEEWERLIQRLPLKRSADLTEISSALRFLIHNTYITGQTIAVDGGYSLVD